MANYKLSLTGEEIDERLAQIPEIGEEVSNLKEEIESLGQGGSGLSEELKSALGGMIRNELAFVSTSHPYADAVLALLEGGDAPDVPDTPTDPDVPDEPETLDTTVKIATYNYGLASGELVEKEGMGVSEKYTVNNQTSDPYHVTYFIKTNGLTSTSMSNKYARYLDGVYVAGGTTGYNTLKDFVNGVTMTPGTHNQVAFPIPLAGVDDDYAYVHETGEILFAGINTPYYGMKNISEVS